MKICIRILLLILACLVLPGLGRAQLIFTTNGGQITITGYNLAGGRNVVIPASTNGFPVTGIAVFAFADNHQMTNVVIPAGITSIGQYAFYDCTFLLAGNIPGTVTNLGELVFGYCIRMTNITVHATNPVYSSVGGVLFNKSQTTLIEFPHGLGGSYSVPATVTNIGFAALSSSALANVFIPASVIGMNMHAFNFCLNLTNITVAAANPAFSSTNGVLFDKSQTELYQFPCAVGGDYIVPSTVVYIRPDSFANSGVTSVVFPKNINNIDYEAFSNCPGLKTVTIPAGVTNLGLNAFEQCDNLTNAYFLGKAPAANDFSAETGNAFYLTPATVFYMPGTTGWSGSYGTAPTVLWNPHPSVPGFAGGRFGFKFNIPSNAVIVVESCTNLVQSVWRSVATNGYSGGALATFSDSQSGGPPTRFYRLRSP